MLKKFCSFEVLAKTLVPRDASNAQLRRLAHRATFDYQPRPGFLYVRSRAISSRCNDNFDEFPAAEIKAAYKTFIGKPVFVNHHNDNHRRARGVVIDAALHEDRNADGTPDTWAEVLMEVDAVRFPRLAKAILAGHIDRTSMGTDVEYSICSACNNKASSPAEYCQHIPRMKGKRIYRATASGRKEGVLIRETCYGLSFFENSLLVEEPADPTAYMWGIDDRGMKSTASKQHPRLDGVSLDQDDDGYFVKTHRARSDSYDSPEAIPDSAVEFIRSTGARTAALLPQDHGEHGPWNVHGQCKKCGFTPETEDDEECDHPYCQSTNFADGWHTKGEHMDPPHLDPYHPDYQDAERAVNDAFGEDNLGWLLDQQATGPSKYSALADPYDATSVRKRGSWIGDHPEEPTLFWRAPQTARWEVHVHNHMPDRDLRERYGTKPYQQVTLYRSDLMSPPHPNAPKGSPPRGGWNYERNSNTGEMRYAPTAWGDIARGIPAHVQRQVDKAQAEVDRHAADHADLYGQAAEQQDIASDLRRVPSDMAAEDKAHRMFRNLLHRAQSPEEADEDPGINTLREHIRQDMEADTHARQRPVNLADPHDLTAHLFEAHGWDHGDLWRNSHPNNHPAMMAATDVDRRLTHQELRDAHDHEHAVEFPEDFPHVTMGDSHFHTASRKTAAFLREPGQGYTEHWAEPAGEADYNIGHVTHADVWKQVPEEASAVAAAEKAPGPFFLTRHPATRAQQVVDGHNRLLGDMPAGHGDGNYGRRSVEESWHAANVAKGHIPEGTDVTEALMRHPQPPFATSTEDPEDTERKTRPAARAQAPEGHSPSEEWHGPYEVTQHPDTGRFHVLDNAGRKAPGPHDGFPDQLSAERSRDYVDRRQQSKEKARGIAENLWGGVMDVLDPGGTDESRRTEHKTRVLNDLMHRYQGGQAHPLTPGRFGADDYDRDGDGEGEPYYEVADPGGSGWTARDYGGPNLHIYHQATPNEAHDLVDAGDPATRNSHDRQKPPGYGHEEMHTDLQHWIHGDPDDEDAYGVGADYARNDPAISRWQRRKGYTGSRKHAYGYPDHGHAEDVLDHFENHPDGVSALHDFREQHDGGAYCDDLSRAVHEQFGVPQQYGLYHGQVRNGLGVEGHSWNQDAEGNIVDLTADQFGHHPDHVKFVTPDDPEHARYEPQTYETWGDSSLRTGSRRRSAMHRTAYGETKAPADVDTLREEACPVCGEEDSYDGNRCQVCGFDAPPAMFRDPDLEVARNLDLRKDVVEEAGQLPGQVGDPTAVPGQGMPAQQVPNPEPISPDQLGPNGEVQMLDPNADPVAQEQAQQGQVDPDAAAQHFDQGGEPFTPGPNAPTDPDQPGEPENEEAEEAADLDPDQLDENGQPVADDGQPMADNVGGQEPGTPEDGVADLMCPACGFTSDAVQPTSTDMDAQTAAPLGGGGTMAGDVCPNCGQAQMVSVGQMEQMQQQPPPGFQQ